MSSWRSQPGWVGQLIARIDKFNAKFGKFIDDGGRLRGTPDSVVGVFPHGPHAGDHAEGATDELDVANLGSGAATVGQVPVADGSGGVDWDDQSGSGTPLTVKEEDGTPSDTDVVEIQVPNGTLIVDSAGVVSLSYELPGAVFDHEAAEDPHPTYTTLIEAATLDVAAINSHESDGGAHTTILLSKGIVDAKGDLIGASADNTPARVPVGANDTILMADSAQSTGLKYVGSQTPSTQAVGDAAAEGTAATYSRGDHKHAMPAFAGTGDIADVATTEAAGSAATIARGDHRHKAAHDGIDTTSMKVPVVLTAGAAILPTTNPVTRATIETSTNDANYNVLDFPDASSKYANWHFHMPDNYDGGAINAKVVWHSTGNSGNVRWEMAAVQLGAGVDPDAAFGTAVTIDEAAQGTAGRIDHSSTITFTPSNAAGGKTIIVRLGRLGGHANDTLAATARVMEVVLEYGISALSA